MASARTNEMVEDCLAQSRLQAEMLATKTEANVWTQLRWVSLGVILVCLNYTSKLLNLLRFMT